MDCGTRKLNIVSTIIELVLGGAVHEKKAYKITPDALEAIWQYHECVPPTETQFFLFPDKNDREVLEELTMNPPPECDDIQQGKN